MKFAQRAKSVNTAAKVNEVLDDKALIRKLRKENETLKQQLQAGSSSVEDSGSLQQRDREWTEVQTRLEDMSRDMHDKELLLQKQRTEKSSVEAELVLSQAREQDLQSTLTEVLNKLGVSEKKVDELEQQLTEVLGRQQEEERVLQQAQQELERLREQNMEWLVAKHMSLLSEAYQEAGTSLNEPQDLSSVMQQITNQMKELRRSNDEMKKKQEEWERERDSLQNQLDEVMKAKEQLETENARMTEQLFVLIPEVKSLQESTMELQTEVKHGEDECNQRKGVTFGGENQVRGIVGTIAE